MSASKAQQTQSVAATAAIASSSPSSVAAATTRTHDGKLYVAGKVGGKTGDLSVPVAAKDVDNMGHVCFPAPLTGVTDSSARFTEVKGEHNIFAALESRPQPGALWIGRPATATMERAIPGNVVSFTVGNGYTLAALKDGSLIIVGAHRTIDGAAQNARPFRVKPPKGVTCVSASELTVAIVCGDEGEVWTIGDAAGNGHNTDLKDEWRQIKLLESSMYVKGSAATTTALAAVAAASANGGAAAAAAAAASSSTNNYKSFKAVQVAQGSIHGAAVTACGKVFTWGDGLSGTLGIGKRMAHSPAGIACGHEFPASSGGAVFVACTTAQGNPKRVKDQNGAYAPGQEGPRCHVLTKAGGELWIAGTTHKGLGANCMYKTLDPEADLLEFYKVGGRALDAGKGAMGCPTGGAEDLARKNGASKETVARHLGMESAAKFGEGGNTNYLTEPGLKIVSTQPTHIHSVAVSEDGRCFSWGCGSDGRTGLEAYLKGPNGAKRMMKCYVSSPSVVEKIETKFCVHAYACRYYTLFVIE